jgi:hypothetical protein
VSNIQSLEGTIYEGAKITFQTCMRQERKNSPSTQSKSMIAMPSVIKHQMLKHFPLWFLESKGVLGNLQPIPLPQQQRIHVHFPQGLAVQQLYF